MSSDFNTDYVVSYAQNREDVILNGFLKNVKSGFYVDVGANHPVHDSVTNLFYKRGWSGINIEPIEEMYGLLKTARPRDINLNVGAGSSNGKLVLRHFKDKTGLSTFSDELIKSYAGKGIIEPESIIGEEVEIRTLKDIFNEYQPKNIHFLKIDVEGFEKQVLKGNDWNKFRPWIICIEANNIVDPWEDLLENNKYKQVFFDGLNKYFVSKEHEDIVDTFSYPETILAKPILTPDMDEMLQRERKEKENTLREIEKAREGWEQINSQLTQLQNEVAHSRRLKGSIKQLLRSIDNVVVTHINNLDKPKVKKNYYNLDTSNIKSADDLLQNIKSYDFVRYYSTNSSKRISYRLTKSVYHNATRQTLRMARKTKLKLKGLN